MQSLVRRRLILGVGAGLLTAATAVLAEAAQPKPAAAPAHGAGAHAAPVGIAPEAALQRLMQGNARYAAGHSAHPDSSMARRAQLVASQAPFATILACADSRVPPELIFDQGLGDLFTVRVAGNVVDDAVLASLEYSVIHLGSTLIMVLGHERCGAVTATLEALSGHPSEADKGSKIAILAGLIAPAVNAVPANAPNRLDAAVSLNAAHAAAAIAASSPPLHARILAGKLKVVAARYDLDDGRVTPVRV